jgi:hypothetical protein
MHSSFNEMMMMMMMMNIWCSHFKRGQSTDCPSTALPDRGHPSFAPAGRGSHRSAAVHLEPRCVVSALGLASLHPGETCWGEGQCSICACVSVRVKNSPALVLASGYTDTHTKTQTKTNTHKHAHTHSQTHTHQHTHQHTNTYTNTQTSSARQMTLHADMLRAVS